jgi:hypothetical protein
MSAMTSALFVFVVGVILLAAIVYIGTLVTWLRRRY